MIPMSLLLNLTPSRTFLSSLIWFIFNLWEEQIIRNIYIILQGFTTFPSMLCHLIWFYLGYWHMADAGMNWSTMSPCLQYSDFCHPLSTD
jgi:hypothetical protein